MILKKTRCLEMRGKHLCVCRGRSCAFRESCKLPLANSPTLVAQKLLWDWRMERAVEGGWAGHSLSTSWQGRESPGFSPGSHQLGKQLCRGINSWYILRWWDDYWEHRPGKGKECDKREKEKCPHWQILKLCLTEIFFLCVCTKYVWTPWLWSLW